MRARLSSRLRALELDRFEDYLKFLDQDDSGQEIAQLIDAITTNKTEFFRESAHFDYIGQRLMPHLKGTHRKVRFWSAGCSFGQEPYSLAILLQEDRSTFEPRDIRILSTDIDRIALESARKGIYKEEELADLSGQMLSRYFTLVEAGPPPLYQVKPEVRAMAHFARLNLMASWPIRGPFDAILCRNVMIYFNNKTREQLIQRFWDLLAEGGHLFVGFAESLAGIQHRFKYVQPAVYVKDSNFIGKHPRRSSLPSTDHS